MCRFASEMWIIVQKSEGLEMYLLELYQGDYQKNLVLFETLEEQEAFVAQIPGYNLEKKMILFKVIK